MLALVSIDLGGLWALLLFFLDLWFAIAVGADAKRRIDGGKPLAFVGPVAWFFATLLGSGVALWLYWVIHYSSLRHAEEFPGRS